ncbi:MAG: nicotinamide riboside transporter PnuC [Tepidisphaera sp.]|nr:nicotinamide riboside transporter PnuC [Tepidisphaera sp.]
MTWTEAIAAATGLLSVWLTVRQNLWLWPTGIISVLLYTWVFAGAKLYSDAGLQVVYLVVSIYGWAHWAKGGPRESGLPVTTLSPSARAVCGLGVLAGAAGLGTLMAHYTDAALPYPDALVTSASIAAQWLLARKKLENWWLWIGVDVLGIGVFVYKGLSLTAGLYAVFLVMAILGLREWTHAKHRAGASSSASSCPHTPDTGSSSTSPGSSAAS